MIIDHVYAHYLFRCCQQILWEISQFLSHTAANANSKATNLSHNHSHARVFVMVPHPIFGCVAINLNKTKQKRSRQPSLSHSKWIKWLGLGFLSRFFRPFRVIWHLIRMDARSPLCSCAERFSDRTMESFTERPFASLAKFQIRQQTEEKKIKPIDGYSWYAHRKSQAPVEALQPRISMPISPTIDEDKQHLVSSVISSDGSYSVCPPWVKGTPLGQEKKCPRENICFQPWLGTLMKFLQLVAQSNSHRLFSTRTKCLQFRRNAFQLSEKAQSLSLSAQETGQQQRRATGRQRKAVKCSKSIVIRSLHR